MQDSSTGSCVMMTHCGKVLGFKMIMKRLDTEIVNYKFIADFQEMMQCTQLKRM